MGPLGKMIGIFEAGVSMLQRVAFSLSVILAITMLSASQARAQVSGARLTGTVTDPSGAAIAGAQVSILNKATGVNRAVVTDSAGLYSAPNLLPGVYDASVSAPGFSTAKELDITLTVGAEQVLNIALRIGEANQTVLVEAAAPLVQLGSSTISSEVESREIVELPLNGRDWASLATLSPGVNAIETQMPFENGALRGNRGFGSQLTISGQRPTQNNYRLDGLSINDYGNAAPGSVIGGNLGVDAIQEFSVVTGNYSAEYGKTSGGVVNAISKSGTNAFHGDVYEFFRNDKLDANDFFSNVAGKPKPPYRRNQFGAAAGGPIRKDRTFMFADYEGIRQAQGAPTGASKVLSDAARSGHLANGTVVPVDPLIQKFLAIMPHANGPVSGDIGQFVFSPTRVVHENFVTTRLDHKISAKDSLFATYTYDDSPFTTQDGFDAVSILSEVTRHLAALEETHIFSPSLVNSARLGFNREPVINNQVVGAINAAAADPTLSVMPGYDIPSFIISPLSRTPAGLPGGFTRFNWNSIQFYDDAFLTRGTHSLKFGFALERMRYNLHTLYLPNGLLRFNGTTNTTAIQDFLTNHPSSLESGLPARVSPRGMRQTLFGGYFQDDWKIRRNLTLNVGLRYEMTTVLNEVQGKLTSLRNISDPLPYCGNTDLALSNILGKPGCAGKAPFYSNPTTLNFEPRFGFAYDPKGDGKTAVRGGFAIFDVLPLPGVLGFSQNWAPFFLSAVTRTGLAGTVGIPPNSPGSAYSNLALKADPTCASPQQICNFNGSYVEPNPKRNYVEQWNINVQRLITPTLTATVGYVGSHGVHMLIRGDDFDFALPTHTSAGWLWPYNPPDSKGNTKDLRINPYFGLIRGVMWNTGSTYEAVQFNVQKRLSHGFQFGGAYTYSKSMDDSSATLLGDSFSNSITTLFWFAPQISRGPSDFNFTHTAVINALWQVPVSSSLHGPAAAVLRGWELSGIFKTNSGVPTTPLIAGDVIGAQNNGSDTFGIPDKIPGCDPIHHNFKSNPGGVFLGYINTDCYTLPKATPEIAAQCVPFGFSPPGSKHPNPGIAGTCSNLLGNAGRNSIVGPNLFNVDFSAHKSFAVKKISEAFNVQFRAEFFNVLNHPNFQSPLPFSSGNNAQIFNADGTRSGAGGLSQPLLVLPRDIQFALKAIF